MAKDHYLPATLIARFASQDGAEPRRRKVYVLRENGVVTRSRVDTIGYANDLYNVDPMMFPTSGTRSVDLTWDAYESRLAGALDHLIEGSLSAEDWIDVVVPFVSAAFGRDESYEARVIERLAGMESEDEDLSSIHALMKSQTNININRIRERDRFAARALACAWELLEFDGELILPDMGFVPIIANRDPDEVVYFMPIGRHHGLLLTPRAEGTIAQRAPTGFALRIPRRKCDVTAFNEELARVARRFMVGPQATLATLAPLFGSRTLAEIDRTLDFWPFNVETRRLGGMTSVVSDVIHGAITSLDGVYMDGNSSIAALEPRAVVVGGSPKRLASHVLALTATGLELKVHHPSTPESKMKRFLRLLRNGSAAGRG